MIIILLIGIFLISGDLSLSVSLLCLVVRCYFMALIRRILEGVREKKLQATLLFVDFIKAFNSIHRGKMEQILQAYGLPK